MFNTNDYPEIKNIIGGLPFGTPQSEAMSNIIADIVEEYRNRVDFSHHDSKAINERVEKTVDKHLAELKVLVDAVVLQTRNNQEKEAKARAERDAKRLEASNAIRVIITREMMELEAKAPEDVKQNEWFKSWIRVEEKRRAELYLGGL